MILLTYVLAIGPTHWPIGPALSYGIAYELMAECILLWGTIIIGVCRRKG